jgi:hypothetical protein
METTMSFLSGWIFDAESNTFGVIDALITQQDIVRLLQCKEAESETFHTSDGAYTVWFNKNLYEQSFYNESAQSILGRIQFNWKNFHGNFLVTYFTRSDDNESSIPQRMPDISIAQFVDACNLAIEKKAT